MTNDKTIRNNKNKLNIVKCKDCKWADWVTEEDNRELCYCRSLGIVGLGKDFFCADGETN